MRFLYLTLIAIFLVGMIMFALLTLPYAGLPPGMHQAAEVHELELWAPGKVSNTRVLDSIIKSQQFLIADIMCISGKCDTVYYYSSLDYARQIGAIIRKNGDTVFIKVSKSFFNKGTP